MKPFATRNSSLEIHQVYVEWRGYPIKFHPELCTSVYSLVAETEATKFATHREAREAATAANLREHVATIERNA